jgi:hypothetical protein
MKSKQVIRKIKIPGKGDSSSANDSTEMDDEVWQDSGAERALEEYMKSTQESKNKYHVPEAEGMHLPSSYLGDAHPQESTGFSVHGLVMAKRASSRTLERIQQNLMETGDGDDLQRSKITRQISSRVL